MTPQPGYIGLAHKAHGAGLGDSLIANNLGWLSKVVNALTGAGSSSRQIKFPHGVDIVDLAKGESRLDGGQSFGSFLTETVSYHH